MLRNGAQRVALHREMVDRMNVFPVPDGDTGTNMSFTLQKMESMLMPDAVSPRELAMGAARGALLGARGNSGVILSQILRGLAEGLESSKEVSGVEFAYALVAGADCAYQAVIKPVEGTILTVAKDAATSAMMRAVEPEATFEEILDSAVRQARITLARTPQMLDKLRQAGVVDAGGQGFVFFLDGMLSAILGEALPEKEAIKTAPVAEVEKLPFLYCTELTLASPAANIPRLRTGLEVDSDSLLVVGGEDLVRVHVHTNDPGAVISFALDFGELMDVKIDNMRRQHNERIKDFPEEKSDKVSVVAVVAGEGMKKLFASLGAAGFVDGGQSMNPSMEQILRAVEAVPGTQVILLPNNPNILLTAAKVGEISSKEVHVVPTKTMVHGVAAMVDFEPAGAVADTLKMMNEAASSAIAAEVTRAVRDSRAGGLNIGKGDVIAIIGEEIVAAALNINQVMEKVVEFMAGRSVELVTLYSGEGMELTEAENILKFLSEKFTNTDFELHEGGQPHYLFLVSGE